jgi:hypothetical protein
VADLDHDQFAVREKAMAELEMLGEWAEPALRKILESDPSTETRRRVERLLEQLDRLTVAGGRLRTLRAIEVLEHIGTPEARRVLEMLAGGFSGSRVTREAKAALDRLARRSVPAQRE